MAARKDGSSKQQTRREGAKPGATRGKTEASRREREHAGASTGGQRATTVGKGEVLPQSQQSAQDECPPNRDDRNDMSKTEDME